MTEELEIIRGSGNVFADFGVPDPEIKLMKAMLAAAIIGTLDDRGQSVPDAAKVARVDPSVIQRIRNADLSRVTLDRLVRILGRLGRTVKMDVLPKQSQRAVLSEARARKERLRSEINAAFDDPRPSIPAGEVLARLKRK